MTTTPYIRVLTAVNADTPTLGARTVTNGDTIAFTYESVVGWASDNVARLEFFSYPDGWAGPGAPWVTESVSVVYNNVTITYDAFVYTGNTAPPSFTAPAGPAWGKYLLSAKLGNGQKNGVASSDMYDESSGFEILSSQGLHDLAWRESASFAEDRPWTRWTEDHRKNLAALDAALALAVPTTRTLTAGAGLTGGGTLASDRTFDVGAGSGITVNANDVAVTWGATGEMAAAANVNAAGTAVKSAPIDHTHALPASSGAAAGTMSAADFTKLSGIEAAADVTDFANVSAALAAASGSVSVNSQKITNLATPAASTDAATKDYVDTFTWYAATGTATLVAGGAAGIVDTGATGASRYILQRVASGASSATDGALRYSPGTDEFDVTSNNAGDIGTFDWYRLR